jgi:hypothetical protein
VQRAHALDRFRFAAPIVAQWRVLHGTATRRDSCAAVCTYCLHSEEWRAAHRPAAGTRPSPEELHRRLCEHQGVAATRARGDRRQPCVQAPNYLRSARSRRSAAPSKIVCSRARRR